MKVVDRRATIRDVFLFTHVDDGLGIGVVHCLSGISSVCECAGDPYGPERIQPIRILDDLALDSGRLAGYSRTLEAYFGDD